ncbi:hypothetical protein B0J11DRAFT_610998 [Dendryphion nanum]|uniref:PAN-3 domain-containing protein n=1 Tax=Dendryphion nanum TaxID=256645 RepID=A0A9P9ED65_9PLEO|nr:hypothetical protein B0J11DRAFT_610998 [Dendryphion nanum]
MGVRSFIFTVLFIGLCINIFQYAVSSKNPRESRLKRHSVKRNPSGGPINGYSVIAPVAPRSEFELERRYDMVECSQTHGAIRDINNKQLQIECGVIHSGEPISTVRHKTFDECLTSCATDNRCVALAFEEVDNKRCHLYDIVPPPRLTRGARHVNWLGAKVLAPSPPSPCVPEPNPIQTLKSASALEAGVKCPRPVLPRLYNKQGVAAQFGTLEQCTQARAEGGFKWFIYKKSPKSCEFYNSDPSDINEIDRKDYGSDDEFDQYEERCFADVDTCAPGYTPPTKPTPIQPTCTYDLARFSETKRAVATVETPEKRSTITERRAIVRRISTIAPSAICDRKVHLTLPNTMFLVAAIPPFRVSSAEECATYLFKLLSGSDSWMGYHPQLKLCSLWDRYTWAAPQNNPTLYSLDDGWYQYTRGCFSMNQTPANCAYPVPEKMEVASPDAQTCTYVPPTLHTGQNLEWYKNQGSFCGREIRAMGLSTPTVRTSFADASEAKCATYMIGNNADWFSYDRNTRMCSMFKQDQLQYSVPSPGSGIVQYSRKCYQGGDFAAPTVCKYPQFVSEPA